MAFGTPLVEHWLEWEIAQWVHPMKDRSNDPSHHEQTLLPRSYISLLGTRNSSMGSPWRIDPKTHHTMSEHSYHGATSCSLEREIAQWVHHEGSIRRPIAPWANTLTTELHLVPWSYQRLKLFAHVVWRYVDTKIRFLIPNFQHLTGPNIFFPLDLACM